MRSDINKEADLSKCSHAFFFFLCQQSCEGGVEGGQGDGEEGGGVWRGPHLPHPERQALYYSQASGKG